MSVPPGCAQAYFDKVQHHPFCFKVIPEVVDEVATTGRPFITVAPGKWALVKFELPQDVKIQAVNAHRNEMVEDVVIAVSNGTLLFARLPPTTCVGCAGAMRSFLTHLLSTFFGKGDDKWLWLLAPSTMLRHPDTLSRYLGDNDAIKCREQALKATLMDKPGWRTYFDRWFPHPQDRPGFPTDLIKIIPYPKENSKYAKHKSGLQICVCDREGYCGIN